MREALQELWGKRLIYLDGGMGTLLQAMGLAGGERPEEWNLRYPERVRKVHEQYLLAGCDIVTANTFGATREHLGEASRSCTEAGVRLAREAVKTAGRGWAALDMGSLGRLLEPMGDLPFDEAVQQFRECAEAGLQAGVDLVLIETMTDLCEVKAAVLGAQEAMQATGLRVPLWVSLTFDARGRLLTGADIRGAAAMLCGLRVDAVGLNCGDEPRALMDNIRELLRWCVLPVFVSPNASLPVVEQGQARFKVSPEEFAKDMAEVAALGVWGLGGCCGTTPEHIHALTKQTKNKAPVPRAAETGCVISGRSDSLILGDKPLLIGERLNPTGKPRMKQALREGDMEYLLREAVAQLDAGADVLDVNVGLPEVDEPATLVRAVRAVQAVSGAPLQLDTADVHALEAALRVYVGKPLINSVCGKEKVMESVFPLAARYGGAVVALTLDENGIPETVEGRLEIARRIVHRAEKYGIRREELLFDALTMTVSTDANAARITLETVERLRAELGVKTVLGVSNVSFGLPQRPLLTAAFCAMAVARGLDALILNPLDTTVRAMVDAAAALSGRDRGFTRYLGAYGVGEIKLTGGTQPVQQSPEEENEEYGLHAIVRGLAADAGMQVEALLAKGAEPLSVIEKNIMPALTLVGDRYEKGTLFLPQLLQSAQAAQAAFDVLRNRLPEKEAQSGRKVVLATVRGDVHDIGKNIVKVLLQNYGFEVADLGRDVEPERILQAVRETRATVCGLSALMTTTVPAMRETIELLRHEAPGVRVMVGGAVLSPEYAAQLGADGYGKDAMAAVRLAEEWIRK